MQRFFEVIVERKVLVIAGMAVMMLLSALWIPRLKLDTSPDAFIPPGHPALISKRRIEQKFGLEDPMLLAVVLRGENGAFEPDGLYAERPLRLIQELTREIATYVSSFPDVPAHPVYSLATELNVEFDPQALLIETPFLEPFPVTPADFQALREHVRRVELYTGVIVSEDGSAGAIIVVPPKGAASAVHARLVELARTHSTSRIELHVAGEAAVRSAMGVAVTRDALRLNPLCVLVIAFFLLLAFRSVIGVLFPLCVVGWGSAIMLGAMGLTGSPIFIITNAILVTVVSLGVADAIHVQGEYLSELGRAGSANAVAASASAATTEASASAATTEATASAATTHVSASEIVVRASSRLVGPVFYTSITDMAGFLSFYLTGAMPPLEQFGIFTALGCGATLVASVTLLPAPLACLNPGSGALARRNSWRLEGPISSGLERLGEWIRSWPRSVTVGSTLLVLFASVEALRLKIDQSMLSAFDEGHEIARADRVINQLFHGTYFLDVLLEAKEPGGLTDLKTLEAIHELEESGKSLPFVKGSISVAGFSRKLNQILHQWDPKELKLPGTAQELKEQFTLLDSSPSKKADFLRTIDPTYTLANVRFRLSSGRYSDERGVVDALQAEVERRFPPGGPIRSELSGRVNLDYHWVRLIVKSHFLSVGCSLALVLLLLFPMYRSVVAPAFCAVPVIVAVLSTYATMAWLEIPLGIGTSMFASLAMGVGVNFPIHVLDRLRHSIRTEKMSEKEAFAAVYALTGKALLFNGAAICFGFAVLCVSDLPILRHFGLMIATGIGAACLSSLTMLPALVVWVRPKFIYGPDRLDRPVS